MRYKGTGSSMVNMLDRFRFKKRKFNPDILDIDDLKLPIVIKELDSDRILRDLRTDVKNYKLLGYRFKNEAELLNMKEYHSHQIGIFLCAIKENYDLQLRDAQEDIFPEFVLKHHYGTIQMLVQDIIKKYERTVNKVLSEQQLINEDIWTPVDAAYLLYYLSFYWKKDLNE